MTFWEVALSHFATGAEFAKCQCCSRRTTKKNGIGDENATRSADQRKQFEGEGTQKVKAAKREDRNEMKKEVRVLRCTSLSGSTWSTERKCMRRYKGKCDIFLAIEHRLRKEEMEE